MVLQENKFTVLSCFLQFTDSLSYNEYLEYNSSSLYTVLMSFNISLTHSVITPKMYISN